MKFELFFKCLKLSTIGLKYVNWNKTQIEKNSCFLKCYEKIHQNTKYYFCALNRIDANWCDICYLSFSKHSRPVCENVKPSSSLDFVHLFEVTFLSPNDLTFWIEESNSHASFEDVFGLKIQIFSWLVILRHRLLVFLTCFGSLTDFNSFSEISVKISLLFSSGWYLWLFHHDWIYGKNKSIL